MSKRGQNTGISMGGHLINVGKLRKRGDNICLKCGHDEGYCKKLLPKPTNNKCSSFQKYKYAPKPKKETEPEKPPVIIESNGKRYRETTLDRFPKGQG